MWLTIAGLGVVVVAVIAGTFVWLNSDDARPIDIDAFVADYRAANADTTVDALGGDDHAYPQATAITSRVPATDASPPVGMCSTSAGMSRSTAGETMAGTS